MSAPAPFGQLALERLEVARLGAKGAWLHWLAAQGAEVPAGFVWVPDGVGAARAAAGAEPDLPAALARLGAAASDAGWAVRASPVHSQPGHLPTRLGCHSEAEVREALAEIAAASRQAGQLCAAVVQHVVDASQGWSAAVFTRDPNRGLPGVRGAYHLGGPGSAVVDGRHDLPAVGEGAESLRRTRPEDYEALSVLARRLEGLAGRILELEVVHDGTRLWVVQARPVRREPLAALRLATERADRSPREWLALGAGDAEGLWVERVAAERPALARGLAASPGVAVGAPVIDPVEAERRAGQGEAVVLVRPHAVPEDVSAVRAAAGVLTATGGLTCHAAVIARGLGRPAVVSCQSLEVDADAVRLGGAELAADALLTLDGHSGAVYLGEVARVRMPSGAPVQKLLAQLRRRRATPLWVYRLPEALWAEAERLGIDGLLVDSEPAEATAPGGLPLWVLETGGRAARRMPSEHFEESRVGIRPWPWENQSEIEPGEVCLAPAAPSGRLPPPAAAAFAVPAEHILAWALTLDPVQASAHNGPDWERSTPC